MHANFLGVIESYALEIRHASQLLKTVIAFAKDTICTLHELFTLTMFREDVMKKLACSFTEDVLIKVLSHSYKAKRRAFVITVS